LKSQEKEAAESVEDSEDSNEDEPTDSMATLIMGFSKQRRTTAPELPPRSDDESVISEEANESYQANHEAA
jgi:hypothetical protein